MINLDPSYNPKNYEQKWWSFWTKHHLFHAKVDPSKKPYTILMPPPNVTSQLHMGHGTTYTFQDLLIRWKRMQGYNACWLPGTDHAGIATQMMVEKNLLKEGIERRVLGREAFVEKCQEWKDKYGGLIYQQFEKIGFSADLDRKAYTMSPELSEAVRFVFVSLFNEGLIYRSSRLVNWDPVLKTAISDDEVENKEIDGHLWHLRYPIEGSSAFITVATTRPETMLGDTAVAVHPDDERFKAFIGKKVKLPLTDRLIPIIADHYVKSEFGTGAVKITPAHDPNDYAIGKRHNLPFIEVFNDDGTMNQVVPEKYRGLDRFEARKEVVRDFRKLELLDKEQHYRHSVPHSERSKCVVEPKLSMQWFLKMEGLAKEAAAAARDERLRFFPESWRKTYLYWMDNIQDWCISRQLWWGHRIPIWYCKKCEHLTTGMTDPTECGKCQSKEIRQDEDVLDTWFSSWLWPLSPFGWPQQNAEAEKNLDYFYPSNVLITAPEIIFLWVARMIMAGQKFLGKVPFQDIYFTAVVTDKQGRKFSKTLGNGIDPIEVIEKHGADAVRFSGVSLAPLGGRVQMELGDFDAGARFINKLWNASRFILKYLDSDTELKPLAKIKLNLPSKWLLTEFAETTRQVNKLFEVYRLNEAVEKIYHFVWGSFCDWAIEAAKDTLQAENDQDKEDVLSVLVYALEGALRLAHPIIPFVTEELWQKLPKHPDWQRGISIVTAAYPDPETIPTFAKEAGNWQSVQSLITGIRSARQQVGLSPKTSINVAIEAEANLVTVFNEAKTWIISLTNGEELKVQAKLARPEQSLVVAGKGYSAFLPVAGLVDFDKEKKRLASEIARLGKIIEGLNKKLSNKNFVDNAPTEIVDQTKAQKANLDGQVQNLQKSLDGLS